MNNTCICRTDAAKYRCRHHVPGYNKCDLESPPAPLNGELNNDLKPIKMETQKVFPAYFTDKNNVSQACVLSQSHMLLVRSDEATIMEIDSEESVLDCLHGGVPSTAVAFGKQMGKTLMAIDEMVRKIPEPN